MHLSVPPRQDGYARPVDQLGRLKLEQDAPRASPSGGRMAIAEVLVGGEGPPSHAPG